MSSGSCSFFTLREAVRRYFGERFSAEGKELGSGFFSRVEGEGFSGREIPLL